jgi:hypothetical protein
MRCIECGFIDFSDFGDHEMKCERCGALTLRPPEETDRTFPKPYPYEIREVKNLTHSELNIAARTLVDDIREKGEGFWRPNKPGERVWIKPGPKPPSTGRGVPVGDLGEVLEELIEAERQELDVRASNKPSNPKDACGIRKPPSSTVPQTVMAEVGVAMLEGAMKYGRHNYRVIGVRASVYYDAGRRHLDYWWEGENLDPDSGLNHITKAIACMVVLRDAMIQGKLNDDRPPAADVAAHRDMLTEVVDNLFSKYPEPKAAYTQEDCGL